MSEPRLAGGPTQDEVLAVSLSKLGLRKTDSVLEIGCGTGKVSAALALQAKSVCSIDRRPEAVQMAEETARGLRNISFKCTEAMDFLSADLIYDCAFLGGTRQLADILPILVPKVRRTVVINAVLINTLHTAVKTLQDLGVFCEVVQVQVARSHEIAGSIMFRPVDPVYIISGRGTAC